MIDVNGINEVSIVDENRDVNGTTGRVRVFGFL